MRTSHHPSHESMFEVVRSFQLFVDTLKRPLKVSFRKGFVGNIEVLLLRDT